MSTAYTKETKNSIAFSKEARAGIILEDMTMILNSMTFILNTIGITSFTDETKPSATSYTKETKP